MQFEQFCFKPGFIRAVLIGFGEMFCEAIWARVAGKNEDFGHKNSNKLTVVNFI